MVSTISALQELKVWLGGQVLSLQMGSRGFHQSSNKNNSKTHRRAESGLGAYYHKVREHEAVCAPNRFLVVS